MSRGARIAVIAGASAAVILVLVIAIVLLAPSAPTTPSAAQTTSRSTPPPTPTPTPTPTFDKSQFSIDDPSSLWVVADKARPLNPKNYVPQLVSLDFPGGKGQMRPEAAAALQQMFADYRAQSGTQLTVVSPYRSYNTQVATYNGWVARLGQAQADRQSARPGTSEHQTGLAVDIDTGSNQGFGSTPPGIWLATNSYKYGFILRYPQGLESITGYEYEPLHFRFVGVALATEMHTTGVQTLEQFFGLPAAPDYPPDNE